MRHELRTEPGHQHAGQDKHYCAGQAATTSVVVGCCLAVVSLWFASWLPILAFILGVLIARSAYKTSGASREGPRYCVTLRTHAIAIGAGLLAGILSGVLQALICFITTRPELAEMGRILPASCRMHTIGDTLIGSTLFTSLFVLLPIGIVALWFRHLARSADGKS